MRRTVIGTLIACAAAATPLRALADLSGVAVDKVVAFQQLDPATTLPYYASWSAQAFWSDPGEFDGGSVAFGGANSPQALNSYVDAYNAYRQAYSPSGDRAGLDASYPDGNYAFTLSNSTTGETAHASVNYQNAFPDTTPLLDQASYTSLAHDDPARGYALALTPFTAPAANELDGQFRILNPDYSVVYQSAFTINPGAETDATFAIDPNLLAYQTNYLFDVSYAAGNFTYAPVTLTQWSQTYAFGSFTTPAPPVVLDLIGGSLANPADLPLDSGLVGGVSADIGPFGQEFYNIAWDGGEFVSTATLTGADPAQSFQFELYDDQGNLLTGVSIDASSNFTGTLDWTLGAGAYVIGLIDDGPYDPQYLISFKTAVRGLGIGSPTPEPGAWVLMLSGIGLTGALVRRRRIPLAA